MWVPSRSQWTVIWVGFVLASSFFYAGVTDAYMADEYNLFGVFVVIGTGLVLYWLEAKNRKE